ncbi:recombination protein NinB [Aureimonas altamirensis]
MANIAWSIADGSRVEIKAPRRSLPQNDRMWAMLTSIAAQARHNGREYSTEQWKVIFMHACGREVQFLPALDGSTFVPWGQSSSDLSVSEMSDLIEFMKAWGAQNGVVFQDDTEVAG